MTGSCISWKIKPIMVPEQGSSNLRPARTTQRRSAFPGVILLDSRVHPDKIIAVTSKGDSVRTGRRAFYMREQRLNALTRHRWQVAIVLTAAMTGIYFGFMLLVAYAKEWVGRQLAPGLSWGVLL